MRGDEKRVVDCFERYLLDAGWSVSREVEHCDLVAVRDGLQLYVEAKGRTTSPGLDVDTMYGQILRRMPNDRDAEDCEFAVVVPAGPAERAARRVPEWVRARLRIAVYSVEESGAVSGPL